MYLTGRHNAGYSGISFGESSGNLFGAAGNVVTGVFGAAGSLVHGVEGGLEGGLTQGAGHFASNAGHVGHQQGNDDFIGGHAGNIAIGGGHVNGGGLIAGQSSEHLKQSANQGSLSAVNANSFIDAGDSSRVSSSKSSSSSSNKSSKRKTNSNFEGSSSNIALGSQGSSQSHGERNFFSKHLTYTIFFWKVFWF